MKTNVYVDGFNLYYGCLHNTPYKWLDIVALSATIIHIQHSDAALSKVHYFTSNVPARFSRTGILAGQNQAQYIGALKTLHPTIQIHEGRIEPRLTNMIANGDPLDLNAKISGWHLEEKETDVKIAIQCYSDAMHDPALQQIVVMSNDSDLAPALAKIREDRPEIRVGMIFPRRANSHRKSGRLEGESHWTRHHILEEELADHQLPGKVSGNVGRRTKTFRKPDSW